MGFLDQEWNWDDALAVRYEEGEEKGREEEKLEIARNLLTMGIPNDQIAKGTGLSLDTINELRW